MTKYKVLAATVTAALIGGGLYGYNMPKKPVETPKKVEQKQPEPIHGFGIIDIDKIYAKHPEDENLKEIRRREIRLRLELNEIMRPVTPPKLPEIKIEPFDEVAREKNMQMIMEKLADLKARKKRLADEYRTQEEPNYLKRRDEIRDIYLNEALNITLKLQNADVLRLKQEEVVELQKKLDALVEERNAKQLELLNEWVAEIDRHVEEVTAEEEAKLRQQVRDLMENSQKEAEQKLEEAKARNKALMEAAAQEVTVRQNRRRKILSELTETVSEREKLETAIFESIVDEAGQLCTLYRLEMVLVNREPDIEEKYFSYNFETNVNLNTKKSYGAVVIAGRDAKDLTQDLIKVIESKRIFKE